MINIRLLVLFVISYGLCMYPAVADTRYPETINFRHVLETHDVALGEIRSIIQDRNGFVWFGADNGLVRYDGYTLKEVRLFEGGSGGKSILAINGLLEDSRGFIWVACRTGLLRYNPILDRIDRLREHASLSAYPLATLKSRDITELSNGDLAVSTIKGLYVVNPDTGSGVRYVVADGLSHDSTRRVLYFAGELWIATDLGLDRLNLSTDVLTRYQPYPEDTSSELFNGVTKILPDEKGGLWIGTHKGLLYFNIASGSFRSFLSLSTLVGVDVWDIQFNEDSGIWISTDGGGLILFDFETEATQVFLKTPTRKLSIGSNVIRTVMVDSQGDLWLGLYPDGVDYFEKSTAAITTYKQSLGGANSLFNDSVLAIAEDSVANLWLAMEDGLDYLNRSTGDITHYEYDIGGANKNSDINGLSLLIDSENILWSGTWGWGVFRLDLESGAMNRLPVDTRQIEFGVSASFQLNNDKVWCVYEDSHSVIWICTHKGGLSQYRRETGEFVHYTEDSSDDSSILSNLVWTVLEDSVGRFWVGTSNGLSLLDRVSNNFTHYVHVLGDSTTLSDMNVWVVFEDSQQRIWLGTGSGLNLFDQEQFIKFGVSDGFINAAIRSISEDSDGNLWLGTQNGVVSFNPETLKVRNFNREGGRLVGGFNFNASVMTESDEAIIGGINGLRFIKTKEISDNTTPPPVKITDFILFSDSLVVGGGDGLLTQSIMNTSGVTLNYAQSVFEVHFAALNYRDSEKNQYAYKLEGFDSGWVYVGAQRRAKYTNLDPGHYVFKVKAANNHGYWNEEGAALNIVIRPPWWSSWWAYVLYGALFFVLLVWAFVTYRSKIRYEQEKSLRASEQLSHDKEVQTEKMDSLINLVSGMAHEFNNPLNFFKAGSYNVEVDVRELETFVADELQSCVGQLEPELRAEMNDCFASIFGALSSMQDGTDRISALVSDLYTFSRLGGGGKDPITIDHFVKGQLSWARDTFGSDIQYVSTCDAAVVFCCETSIDQAFKKIIANACQSMLSLQHGDDIADRRLLNISMTQSESAVEIRISDNGTGIAEADLPHIFEPFFTKRPVGEGVGLGLAIAYSAVQGEGGSIYAESEVTVGTTVIVKLPKQGAVN